MIEIRHYLTAFGKNTFQEWLDSLKDPKTEARIAARIARLMVGNFGDCKPLRDGIWELRIDVGPGYRVYYAMTGRMCVLLLCGGNKRRQSADIDRAVAFWNDYQRRSGNL
ncbi:MAG: type II toxin-antitoxin system RelE/ParE family toxin [Thermoguttaceae bacterium]